MSMPYGNNMNNLMPMPYQAASFNPNHVSTTILENHALTLMSYCY